MPPRTLRSARWFEPDHLRGFGHRSRARQMGYDERDWAGKPVIAILNTWTSIAAPAKHIYANVDISAPLTSQHPARRQYLLIPVVIQEDTITHIKEWPVDFSVTTST